jgi:hypothetical protein
VLLPEWLLIRLDASDRRLLSEHFAATARQLAAAADQAERIERISATRRNATQGRRDANQARNRQIWSLYRQGRSDAEISAAVDLSERQVRRVLAELRRPFLTRLRASGGLSARPRQDQHRTQGNQPPQQPAIFAAAERAEARQREQAAAK